MDAGFLAMSLGVGLAVAAPVGPMSLLCIQRTLDAGRAAGLAAGAGIAAADGTYATLAAFGVSAVSSRLLAGTFWISLAGSLLMLFLGARIALAKPATGDSRPRGRSMLGTYALTLANPPTILFFAGIFASTSVATAPAAQPLTFAIGVAAGSALWWTVLTAVVAKSARLLKPAVMLWINRACGAVLAAFAVRGLAALA
ncbi:MAG TPA: LysE family transporter [Burkholderiales bacterium]|nr:LysE family transporter [Burkholderiales bacterium]